MQIIAASTISHQPTFRNKGFSSKLSAGTGSGVQHPDYTEFITAMNRRRMSDVLKMSIACTIDCLDQASISQPQAIIVGTGMGCCIFTKQFLEKIRSSNGGLLSPTSFILSTHNTIAGQISLLLGNHSYNMTHTQNSLSFEQTLIDGCMCIAEGCKNVLVGGADEMEDVLYNMDARLQTENTHTASGASFFILSSQLAALDAINLLDVKCFGLTDNLTENIMSTLDANKLSTDAIDLVLYASSHQKSMEDISTVFPHSALYDYQNLVGVYFTNSAFALHYAIDILLHTPSLPAQKKIRTILICNSMIPENLGLILITLNARSE